MIATDGSGQIYVLRIPGDLVDPTDPIAFADGLDAKDQEPRIRVCFSIGDVRSYDQAPRFGASVLTEIASRALSPGMDDPGTAIDVIGRAVRLIAIWGEPLEGGGKVEHPNLHVPPINVGGHGRAGRED